MTHDDENGELGNHRRVAGALLRRRHARLASWVVVPSAVPPKLAAEVDDVLMASGVRHVMHGDVEPVATGVATADDNNAMPWH